jgi:hypothetical protein
VELDPQLFSRLSWIKQIKEDDLGHIFYVLQRNQLKTASLLQTAITKFDSSWTPHLSGEGFEILVKNTKLNSLVLSETQSGSEIFEKLPSLAEHFKELTKFIIKNCGMCQ